MYINNCAFGLWHVVDTKPTGDLVIHKIIASNTERICKFIHMSSVIWKPNLEVCCTMFCIRMYDKRNAKILISHLQNWFVVWYVRSTYMKSLLLFTLSTTCQHSCTNLAEELCILYFSQLKEWGQPTEFYHSWNRNIVPNSPESSCRGLTR